MLYNKRFHSKSGKKYCNGPNFTGSHLHINDEVMCHIDFKNNVTTIKLKLYSYVKRRQNHNYIR